MHKIASHQKQLIERDQLQFYLGLILIKKQRDVVPMYFTLALFQRILFSVVCGVSKIMDVPLN